jgi:glycosyltransferase involved in cell wall biosynthesis
MKKKLLFAHYKMNVGGVESALLATLRLLSPDKYDITLMLTRLGGPLFHAIPPYVKVMEIPLTPIGDYRRKYGWNATVKEALRTCCLWHAVRMLALKAHWLLFYKWRGISLGDIEAFQINASVDVAKLPRGFDFAFAYFGGILNGDFVSRYYGGESITGIWFHNEGTRFKYRRYREVTRRFDHVFACSKSLADFFNRVLSHGDICFETMPHYVDLEEYRRRAEAGEGLPAPADGCCRILTVARLDYQKGVDIAIEAAKQLKKSGSRFVWYVVGGGACIEKYECIRDESGLTDSFVFLGERRNPFPCYRDCDIYVQPSRVEAYCLTIAEARAFSKPIVTTATVGGSEQIEDGKTGLVVPVGDAEALASAVGRLLSDEALRRRLSDNLALANANQIEATKKAWAALLSETKEGMRK